MCVFSRLSSFLLAAQVFDVLEAEGILTYDFPPSELQEEVDDTIDTELEDILVLMLDLAGSLDETAAAICSGNPYDNCKFSDL